MKLYDTNTATKECSCVQLRSRDSFRNCSQEPLQSQPRASHLGGGSCPKILTQRKRKRKLKSAAPNAQKFLRRNLMCPFFVFSDYLSACSARLHHLPNKPERQKFSKNHRYSNKTGIKFQTKQKHTEPPATCIDVGSDEGNPT